MSTDIEQCDWLIYSYWMIGARADRQRQTINITYYAIDTTYKHKHLYAIGHFCVEYNCSLWAGIGPDIASASIGFFFVLYSIQNMCVCCVASVNEGLASRPRFGYDNWPKKTFSGY